MTKQEYLKVQIGDMIKIKWNGRIVTIKGEDSPWFKFRSGNTDGFMIGNVFYGYKQCEFIMHQTSDSLDESLRNTLIKKSEKGL